MKTTRLFFLLFVCTTVCTSHALAQWVQTNGPWGGYVQCFAASGTKLFAGTGQGNIYLSTNNGSSWTGAVTGLSNIIVQALAVSGTNVFAGTRGGGMYRSSDDGANWESINTGL